MFRFDNEVSFQLGSDQALTLAGNDKLGLGMVGNTLTVYVFKSGSWSSVTSAIDATYPGAGYIAIGLGNSTGFMDDFGGGTVISPLASDTPRPPMGRGATW
jgi:hypothetical protein